MPKKIKEKLLEKSEKTNCVLAIIEMLIASGFAGVLVWLGKELDENIAKWKCLIVFGVYMLFFIFTAVHCVQGISVFKKHENYGILFRSIISGAAAVTALANLQFAITLLLSSLKLDNAAQRVIGSRTFDDFIAAQRGPWVLLLIGITAAILIGFAGIAALADNRRKMH